jgi:nucleotide-binding universal stress UspA family protein
MISPVHGPAAGRQAPTSSAKLAQIRTQQRRSTELAMTFRKIVVGMDFSDAAISAAKWASQCFAPTADLVLAHAIVLPHRPIFATDAMPSSDTIKDAAVDFATSRLDEVASSLSAKSVRQEIRPGNPTDVIHRVVFDVGADLVVIGPHGMRPHTAGLLGSVADRIVRLSPVSVLVGTNPRQRVPKRILVGVDDSRMTPHVLAQVRSMADAFEAHVTLLHAWSDSVYSHVASMSYATAHDEQTAKREIREEITNEGQRWLETLARTGLSSERVKVIVTHGNAGDETLAVADRLDPDLIVLGRRGSGLVAAALLGSTLGTVVRQARCPVLVVADPGEGPDK